MRRVAGGGSTTSSRWLSNEGCLPLREKAMHALHYSTWRIWGEPLPPPAQVRGDQPCAGTGGGCGVEKGWLRISLFCSADCRLRCEMVKFAQRISSRLAFVRCSNYLCKILGEQKIRRGLSAPRR
jgi:hypothetical protein